MSTAPHARETVAFVLPVYNEEQSVPAFYEELARVFPDDESTSHEFIFINDGSRDTSLEILTELRRRDPRVTIVNLARNFGQQTAMTAGLDLAHESGADAVVIMDTDLQDPPTVAQEMLERRADGVDVVYGQRRTRQDTLFKRATASGFYWLLQKISESDIPRNTGDFRVIDKKVLREVVRYREHDRFLRGIVAQVGFRQEAHLFDRDSRYAGSTKWPVRKLLRLAATGLFGFSTLPLKLITQLGSAISVLSLLYGVFIVVRKIVDPGYAVPGWAFTTAALLFFSGVQLLSLGIIGAYVGRTYLEVLDRPLYSIESVSRGR